MSEAHDIEEVAARWLLLREEPEWSSEDETAFQNWCDQSLAHKAAYWRLEHAWYAANRLAAIGPKPTVPYHGGLWRGWGIWACAASIIMICGFGWLIHSHWLVDAPVEYRVASDVGSRKQVTLADGSVVLLNTATTLRISLDKNQRRVWLDRGEAFFDVVHDARRPFEIFASGHEVTVLGTRFSVDRSAAALKIAVERGAVQVDRGKATSTARSMVVPAGNIAIIQGQSVLMAALSPDKIEDALSWRTGMLTFDQVTLGEAVAQFNRYNRRQIRFGDESASQIRIGGSFEATNIDAFGRLLHEAFGLHIQADAGGMIISS